MDSKILAKVYLANALGNPSNLRKDNKVYS